MAITRERFDFALGRLESGDWLRFEQLSSDFMATEFTGLRTMASPGGDGGRDAELYVYGEAPKVLLQYSVQAAWRDKILGTLKRLKVTFPDVSALIFVSSQEIGAEGDDLTASLRKEGVHLDIRDRSWFVDRMHTDDQRANAAVELARTFADPILADKGLVSTTTALSGQEARTALVFLEMQARDESSAKGLTKASFESLVRAALQGSSESEKLSRSDIHDRIRAFLPRHTPNQLARFIDAAMDRMTKSVIKRHPGDLFHISHDESEKTRSRLSELAILGEAFSSDVTDISSDYHREEVLKKEKISQLARKSIEIYLYRLGEEFAQAVTHGKIVPLNHDDLKGVVKEVAPKGRALPNESWVDYLYRIIVNILSNPSNSTRELLRVLSASYTLFAFLEEVPDVQKVTKKLFSNATIWLDTSAVLPLVAEQAFQENDRPFTEMMIQSKRSGLKLIITYGILEELASHLSLCRAYIHKGGEWEGRVPYVYQRYILAGKPHKYFLTWLENFMGDHRPQDDLADFLFRLAKVEVADSSSDRDLNPEMVGEVKRYWHEVQDRRRGDSGSSLNSFRLADHDIENYLSVLAERRVNRSSSALGYTSWLLSLDSAAWNLRLHVSSAARKYIDHDPLISADFLIKYLAFGPRRDQAPLASGYFRAFQPTIYESVSSDLIAAAEQIRESCNLLPDHLVRRRIRDGLDKQRMLIGEVQRAGLDSAHTIIADSARK